MTWRERIQAARERGRFSPDDTKAWGKLHTCPAGEVVTGLGCEFNDCLGAIVPKNEWWLKYRELWMIGDHIGEAIHDNDFDTVERLIAEIEDKALEIKRGVVSAEGGPQC